MEEIRSHVVYRNGSFWTCRHCPRSWPYPSPIPKSDGETCTPRALHAEES